MILMKILIGGSLSVVAMYFSLFTFNTYSDVRKIDELNKKFLLVSELKNTLAIKYNKNPQEITKDDIIAHMPSGENWNKLLSSASKSNVDDDANFFFSSENKLQIFALEEKIRNLVALPANSNEKHLFLTGERSVSHALLKKNFEKALKLSISYAQVNKKKSFSDISLTPDMTFMKDKALPFSNKLEEELKKNTNRSYKRLYANSNKKVK